MKEELAERERMEEEFQKRKRDEGAERLVGSSAGGEDRPADDQGRAAVANPRVFFELEVRGHELLGRPGQLEASGRLEFELFMDVVPRTAENFRCLCTGERGKDLHFKDSIFHRIIPGFMAQGGDFTDFDGTGGRSIYGKPFADEGFARRHDARGILSMANSGPNTNNSQFFILFKPAPHLDRKHVVFGRLVREEAQLLRRLEERGSKSGDVKGTVRVVACGELPSPSPGTTRNRRDDDTSRRSNRDHDSLGERERSRGRGGQRRSRSRGERRRAAATSASVSRSTSGSAPRDQHAQRGGGRRRR